MPPLLADFIHAGACIPICEKFLTRPIGKRYGVLLDENILEGHGDLGFPLTIVQGFYNINMLNCL